MSKKKKKPKPVTALVASGESPKEHPGKTFHIFQVIRNADLRIMHFGMTAVAKHHGIKIAEVPVGNAVLFVNTDARYLKLLVSTGNDFPVVVAYHMPPGKRFPLEAVADISKAFRYPTETSATFRLKKAMEEYYARKTKSVSPAAQ